MVQLMKLLVEQFSPAHFYILFCSNVVFSTLLQFTARRKL